MRCVITAGDVTQLGVQWAARLGRGDLLIPYKNALVYIEQRGWFDNTFGSVEDLDAEVTRVLDLRVRMGVEAGWDEFPYPVQWASRRQPSYASMAKLISGPAAPARPPPPVRTLDDLRAEIMKVEKGLRASAIESLRSKVSWSAEQTVCFMWKLDGSRRAAVSGGSLDVSAIRTACGVDPDKETVCAEEVFLAKLGTKGWVASASYDTRHGWKRACSKGCKGILKHLVIVDLADDLHLRATSAGAKSWSTRPE